MRYLLLFDKLTAKKPTHYCEVHRCGVTKHISKKKCWKCRRLKPMNAAYAEEIKRGK